MTFIWAAAYSAVYLTAEKLTVLLHLPSCITPAAMVIYVAALLYWLHQSRRAAEIGLRPLPKASLKQYAALLPLLLLPVLNLLTIQDTRANLSILVLSLCGAVTEEVFFRGFLLQHWGRRSKSAGLLLSSVAFALFHCVNFFLAEDPGFVVMQILCAFAAGFCYGAVTLTWRNILPCTIAHLAANLTGAFATPSLTDSRQFIGFLICILAYLCYGVWIYRKYINCKEINYDILH